MRRFLALLTVALCLVATGCKEEPPPPPPTAVPPEPTPEEIYSELKTAGQPILSALSQDLMTNEARDGAISAVRGALAKHQAKENGRIAIGKFVPDVTEFVRQARDGKPHRPRVEMAGVMLYEVVRPGDDRYAKRKETLKLLLARPRVSVRGFIDSAGELIAFLEVKEADSEAKEMYKIREGEEFHNVLKLIRIIGNNQAVEIEYLPLKDTFEVPGPKS
jgi:hypothetical protein